MQTQFNKSRKEGKMKILFCTILFFEASLSFPNSDILNLKTDISFVKSLVDHSILSIAKDPAGSVLGVPNVVVAAANIGLSLHHIGDSFNAWATHISNSNLNDVVASLTLHLDDIYNNFDRLIPASNEFSDAITEDTVDGGNIDLFGLQRINAALGGLKICGNALADSVETHVNTPQGGSTIGPVQLAGKVQDTAVAQKRFTVIADKVHGPTGVIFGVAQVVLSVRSGLQSCAEGSRNLAKAISAYPAYESLAKALDAFSETQTENAAAFIRLAYP